MKKQTVSKGFAVLSMANMIVKIFSFLYVPFLIAIIGEEGWGIYSAIYSVYVFIYVLANSGVPVAISKLISELVAEQNYRDAIRSFKIARALLLGSGLLLGLIMLITANQISSIIKQPDARLGIILLSPTLLFTALVSAYRGFFQGCGNMTPTAVSQIIEQVINTIFSLLFAFLLVNKGLAYAAAGGTVGTTIGAIVAAVYLIIQYKKQGAFKFVHRDPLATFKRRSYKYLMRTLVNYSIPITLSVGLTYAGNLIDTWNVNSRLISAGFSSKEAVTLYGYLAKYITLMNLPIALITSLCAVIMPAIAGAIAISDDKAVESKVNYAFRLTFLIAIPAATGLSVLSKPIYALLHFGGGYEIMMYGSIVLALMSIVQIQNSILQSCGKLYNVTINLGIGIIIKVVSNYILLGKPEINIYGAIIGSIAGYTVPIILNQIQIIRTLNVKINLSKNIVPPVAASLVMTFASSLSYIGLYKLLGLIGTNDLFSSICLFFSIGFGAVVYALVLYATGGLNKEDIRFVPARFRKFIH